MGNQTLNGVTFEWDPDDQTLPESYIPTSVIDTWNGSAIFQWPERLVGVEVISKWEWMSVEQYNMIRAIYLSTSVVPWYPGPDAGTDIYNVLITTFTGELLKTHLYDQPYRANVLLVFNIRGKL